MKKILVVLAVFASVLIGCAEITPKEGQPQGTPERYGSAANVELATTEGQGTQPKVSDPIGAHWARLVELDEVYRTQGWQAWLSAAGITWDSLIPEARQVEEEFSPEGRILASGIQIRGRNVWIGWPNIITSDRPTEIRTTEDTMAYQPDARNGSTLYTNVWLVDGIGTIWTSGYSWGQFSSRLGVTTQVDTLDEPAAEPTAALNVPTTVPTVVPAPTVMPSAVPTQVVTMGCYTIRELNERYGIETGAQGAREGLLYDGETLSGAVLRLSASQIVELESLGWTIQGSNPDVKSAWSPETCRPLAFE